MVLKMKCILHSGAYFIHPVYALNAYHLYVRTVTGLLSEISSEIKWSSHVSHSRR